MKRKQQSTNRALKRGNKMIVTDKTTEGGFAIVELPGKNKENFRRINKKRVLGHIEFVKKQRELKDQEAK